MGGTSGAPRLLTINFIWKNRKIYTKAHKKYANTHYRIIQKYRKKHKHLQEFYYRPQPGESVQTVWLPRLMAPVRLIYLFFFGKFLGVLKILIYFYCFFTHFYQIMGASARTHAHTSSRTHAYRQGNPWVPCHKGNCHPGHSRVADCLIAKVDGPG